MIVQAHRMSGIKIRKASYRLDFQKELQARNAELPENRRMEFIDGVQNGWNSLMEFRIDAIQGGIGGAGLRKRIFPIVTVSFDMNFAYILLSYIYLRICD